MIENILNFWFDYKNNNNTALFNRPMWWQKDTQVDQTIQQEFGAIHQKIVNGECDDWQETPRGTLAYVILIDQFSRNMFRQQAKMYAYDPLALAASKAAITKSYDLVLSPSERVFLYMPFEHSENIDDQKQCLILFEQIASESTGDALEIAKDYLHYAKEHYDIIKKFNRFPHRNKILSRESTPQEHAFMQIHKGF